MTDSERFLARVLIAWLDYGLEVETASTLAQRHASIVAEGIERHLGLAELIDGPLPTSAGRRLLDRLRAEEAAERRAAETAGRALVGGAGA